VDDQRGKNELLDDLKEEVKIISQNEQRQQLQAARAAIICGILGQRCSADLPRLSWIGWQEFLPLRCFAEISLTRSKTSVQLDYG
jgi:hypothetical protein